MFYISENIGTWYSGISHGSSLTAEEGLRRIYPHVQNQKDRLSIPMTVHTTLAGNIVPFWTLMRGSKVGVAFFCQPLYCLTAVGPELTNCPTIVPLE